MALTKCIECGKEVSSYADNCPHCGAPTNLEIIEEKKKEEKKKKDLLKVEELSESCKPFTVIINFLVSLAMLIAFVAIDIDNYFLIEYKSMEYELVNVLTRNILLEETLIIYGAIGLITFISYFLTIISKRTNIVGKIGYIINIILQIVYFNIIFENDYRLGLQFYVIFGLNILLFLLPRFDKVKSEEVLVSKEEKTKIEKSNQRIEKLYSKKRFNKITIISLIISLLFASISIISIYNKNSEEVEPYKQRNPDKLDQIKVKTDYINVRSKPSPSSKFIGKIYEDDIYNIIDIVHGDNDDFIWYEIKYEGKTAYVASDCDEPYVKIIYNDDYETPEDYGKPNNRVERKLQPTLSNQGYIHSDNSRYAHYYYSDGAEILTFLYLDENTFGRYSELEEYKSAATYYYLEDKVTYSFTYSSVYYGEFTYNINNRKFTCDSNVPDYCTSGIYSDIDSFAIPITESFYDLLDASDLELDDF